MIDKVSRFVVGSRSSSILIDRLLLRDIRLIKRYNSEWSTEYIKKSRPGVEGYDLPPLTVGLRKEAAAANSSKLAKSGSIDIRSYDTHVSTLDNGMRVASEKLFGDFCTLGVIMEAGPRFETSPLMSGTSHFLEKLAFGTSSSFKSRESILDLLEKHGGISDCQSGRDVIIYALSCRRSGLPDILNLLSDTLYRPEFTDDEMEQVRRSIEFEIEDLNNRPDPEPLLTEMLHKAAFNNGALANPKICPAENIEKITRNDLYSYMKTLYTPSRTVLACVGVEHENFVRMVNENFTKTPIWKESNEVKVGAIDDRKAVWQGGSCIIEKDLSVLNQGSNNQLPELTHLVVGLEGANYLDEKDFVTCCVINTMMGGGGSFSAGGPGKGMYSRLYLNVLNNYHFMFSATAYNQSYKDSGIFCIHASAPSDYASEMCLVIGKELLRMAGPCEKDELNRAKTQLQSMLFMNLEQRPVLFEDVARQVLSRGKREKAQYYFDRIQAVEEADVKRVAKKMLESPPAVASFGRLGKVQPYEQIKKILSTGSSSNTRKLFRSF